MKPDVVVIAVLAWLATVAIGGTVYLISVDKPYIAVGSLVPTIVGGLLMYVGVRRDAGS